MDGLIVIDKPEGLTSHDVVARVRRILRTKRIGHAGTLDPFATGVLVLLVGKATRLARFIDKDEKEYKATVRLGFETETGDRTGIHTSQIFNGRFPAMDDVEAALSEFRGEIDQIPPMFSAKKIGGNKLYELARRGESIDRKPNSVNIYKLEVDEDAVSDGRGTELRLDVVCSAGTYIRVLAQEIGNRLGTGAHLAELRRIRSGRFAISAAIELGELEKSDSPETLLMPIEKAVEHLPSMVLDVDRLEPTRKGLGTRINVPELVDGQAVRMIDVEGGLAAVGYYNSQERSVRPKIVLI